MNNNPFSDTANEQDPSSGGRQSTRIGYVTPLFIFGRDAAGQPFRELTQSVIVNLHGCKVRTAYRVLVGMALMVECPKTGMSGKAVCVKVWDAPPGAAGCEIAVQLIKPQNLWGVPNPPADWEQVVRSMVQGRASQGDPAKSSVRAIAPVALSQGVPPRAGMVVPSVPSASSVGVAPHTVAPTISRVATLKPLSPPVPSVEQRLAELEQRSTRLVDSVLDILRSQAEELTRASLEVFRHQVEALVCDMEQRLRREMRESYEESASALVSLRKDIMEQMTARGTELARSTEEALRNRFRELLDAEREAAAEKPGEQIAPK